MADLPKDKTHALLERWAKGDDAALSELFPAYFEKVVGLIALDGLPPEDIEDAVHDAFVKLHLWLKKGNAHPERLDLIRASLADFTQSLQPPPPSLPVEWR